jgi:ABC-type branched-subunit amino acid transport system substrate-binding protein
MLQSLPFTVVLRESNTPLLKRRGKRMKKACLFFTVFAAFCFMFGNAALAAESQPKVYKLGFLSGLSGSLAQASETQRKAVELLVEQVNAKGGLNMPWGKMKVEMLTKDDEMKLDVGVRRFRELVEAGCMAVTGTVYNPMAGALNEECKITGTIYMPGCVPALDSFKKGNPAPATYSVAFTPWSIGYLLGDALIKGLGKKTIYWEGRPDSWGTVMLQGLEVACKELGGKIVGSDETQKGTPDHSAVINKALAAKPDVFVTNHFGGDAVASLKQAYDMGLHKVSLLVNAWTLYDVGMGIPQDAAENVHGLTYYYWNSGDFNKELAKIGEPFVEAHIKKYGLPPDAYAALIYDATSILFQALEKAGTVDSKKVGELIGKETWNALKGPAKFRVDHQLTGQYLALLVKGKKASEKKDKYDVFKVLGAYGGDKALPPLTMLGY